MDRWVSLALDLIWVCLLNDDTFSFIVSTPYSYSCKRFSKDAEDQLEAAMGASHSLKTVHGTVFTV